MAQQGHSTLRKQIRPTYGFKLKLILLSPQDSDSNPRFSIEQTTYRQKKHPMFVRFYVFLCVLSLTLGIPFFAEAGILSMMSNVFGTDSQNTSVLAPQTAQQMDLLEAATNSDPTRKKDDQGTSIVNGAALTNENSLVSGSDTNAQYNQSSDRINLYTVRKGDTLQQIADMYQVSANTILWANDLKRGSAVTPGQVLIILPVSGVKYIVKKGDTVQSVAKNFKADPTDVAQYNNLDTTSSLAMGDELIIPDGVMAHEGDTVLTSANSSSKISVPTGSTANTTPIAKSNGKGTSKLLTAPLVDASLANLTSTSKLVSTSGYFIRPINGGVKTQGLHGHNGIDLASSYGTPIHAAADGTVLIAKSGGWNGGYGTYVVIQHDNGTQTLYGHMSAIDVSVGDVVNQGQQIGKMGNTGESTGVHLHFEVRGGVNPF